MADEKVKRNVHDSVFCDLFSDPKYRLELFQCLHPECAEVTAEDITNVTLKPVLIADQYNDLGFTVQDMAIFLVEAQSTWCPNMPLRALMYLGDTYRTYLRQTEQFQYARTPVHLPRPELYVLYTGEEKHCETQLSIADVHWNGDNSFVDIKVRILYGNPDGTDIVSQYVAFTEIMRESIRQKGRTREAVRAAIAECIKRGILTEYFKVKEATVVDIMTALFDHDYNEEMFGVSKFREGIELSARVSKLCQQIVKGDMSLHEAVTESGLSQKEFLEIASKHDYHFS